MYWDVGRSPPNRFTQSMEPLVPWCREHNGILPGVLIGPHGPWTKRDCFHYMGCDSARFWNAHQVQATFSLWSGKAASEFVSEWLTWCRDRRCLTDDPNECGLPNLRGFREHRHDQSVLTNLCVKHGVEALAPLPLSPGMWTKDADICAAALEDPDSMLRSTATEAEAHWVRGMELRRLGRLDEAMAEFERALRLRPSDPVVHFSIGAIHRAHGQLDLAVESLWQAIRLKPDYHEAYAALGADLRRRGRVPESLAACAEAARLSPRNLTARANLAAALHAGDRLKEAAAAYEAALALAPDDPRVLNNYGNVLAELQQPVKAIQAYRAGLRKNSNNTGIYSNFGNLLRKQGKISEAIDCYRRCLELKPDDWVTHSNLLFALNCDPRSESGLLAEHKEWARRHAAALYPPQTDFDNDRSSERRLRVGYVSPDFRFHPVAAFLEPVLASHDPEQVEVFCYSDVTRPDAVTARLRQLSAHWHHIAGQPDDLVIRRIRDDQIDILVDLAGHTGNHRLRLFARRAAPVQVTYLGYPNTTGLATMDYRITDAISDPPGLTESHYTEQLIRLPHGFLCYQPHSTSHQTPPPRWRNGSAVTLASFNTLAKVTGGMVDLWAQILREAPCARILLKAEGLADEQRRAEIRSVFESRGVSGDRIDLLATARSFEEHLLTYNRVHIGLDTFPYNGATTTCEAISMGVPVVTLAGRAHLSRVGASLLTRLRLEELVAHSEDEYVTIAVQLVHDAPRRHQLSDALSNKLCESSLTRREAFVSDLEAAYRETWRQWCEGGTRYKPDGSA